VGLYGVIAYSVTQRTREIGIRLALGAEVRQVRAMVVRQGMLLAAGGVGLAIAGAFGLSRVAAGLLHGIAGADALHVLGQLNGAAVNTVASSLQSRRLQCQPLGAVS
jgi:putative ABC transport system permease protein